MSTSRPNRAQRHASNSHPQGPSVRLPATENDVRRAAYRIYESKGCQKGFAEQDWLQAEKELRAQGRSA